MQVLMASPSIKFSSSNINVLRGTFDSTNKEAIVSYGSEVSGNFLSTLTANPLGASYRYEIFSDSNNNGSLDVSDSLVGSLEYEGQDASFQRYIDGPGFLRVTDLTNSVSGGAYGFQILAEFNSATTFIKGLEYKLGLSQPIRDFDGYPHGFANLSDAPPGVQYSYKFQGDADVNRDGRPEAIFTNKLSARWASVDVDPITGQIDYSRHGQGGSTRVVGIYIDPLVEEGEKNGGFLKTGEIAPKRFGPFDSQQRFQNDLKIDNLTMKTSGDYDKDGFQELYWKVNDGTAYLRSIMHADGNIQYANYQSESQLRDYLTSTNNADVLSAIV
jgi:hypothetical protein